MTVFPTRKDWFEVILGFNPFLYTILVVIVCGYNLNTISEGMNLKYHKKCRIPTPTCRIPTPLFLCGYYILLKSI
jgi:hypothetical protein